MPKSPSAEEPAAEPEAAAEEAPAEEAPAEEPAAEEPAAEPEAAAEELAAEEAPAEEAPRRGGSADEPRAAESSGRRGGAGCSAAAVRAEEEGQAPSAPPAPAEDASDARRLATGERKPVVRQPKPEHERGRRQERRGVVVSNAMDKTIVVKVDVITSHQRYKKVIRRSVKFHAHDEQNAANIGDVVRIVETRPLSKTKHWRLAEIVEVAK